MLPLNSLKAMRRGQVFAECLEQERDVVAPIPQRRDVNLRDVQPVEQVGAEGSGVDRLLQVALGRSDGPEICLDLLVRAQALNLPFLQDAQQFRLHIEWKAVDFVEEQSESPPVGETIETQILQLSGDTETRRYLKSEALKLTLEVLRTRWRVLESAEGSVPRTMLFVVIFWLSMTFASFGLAAPKNATVITVFVIAALSVAASVFLILELDGPLEGIIKISSAPFRFALANLGK